jgi:DNA-binding transcriptional LysR family regulator
VPDRWSPPVCWGRRYSSDVRIAAVRGGAMEFFVADAAAVAREPDVQVRRLLAQRMAFFARSEHPLAGRMKVTRSQLMDYPLASPRIPPRLAAWVRGDRSGEAWWGDFPEPPPAIECENFSVLKTVVAGSDAISAAPVSVFAAEQRAGRLVELNAEMPAMDTAVGIVSLRNRTLSPAALALIEFLVEADAHGTAK